MNKMNDFINLIYNITSLWWTNVMVGGTCENNDRLKGLIDDRTRGDVCTQFLFFPADVPTKMIILSQIGWKTF